MPQPYPKHLKNFKVEVGVAALKRPQHLMIGMYAVSLYSQVDLMLATAFSNLLGSDPAPTVAMLNSLRNGRIRREAMVAVAKDILIDEEMKLFRAVLSVTGSVEKERNRLAHWLWGIDDQLPDKVVLVDPSKMAKVNTMTTILKAKGNNNFETVEVEAVMEQMRASCLVYSVAHLQAVEKRMVQANVAATNLGIYLGSNKGSVIRKDAEAVFQNIKEIKDQL